MGRQNGSEIEIHITQSRVSITVTHGPQYCIAGTNNVFWFIYTTIGVPSSKFDEFLAVQTQFDSDHGVDFSTLTSYQSVTFVQPLFAF